MSEAERLIDARLGLSEAYKSEEDWWNSQSVEVRTQFLKKAKYSPSDVKLYATKKFAQLPSGAREMLGDDFDDGLLK